MIKAFNAFQIVVLFMCSPFLVQWSYKDPFPFSTPAFWISLVVYVVLFVVHVIAMVHLIEDTR